MTPRCAPTAIARATPASSPGSLDAAPGQRTEQCGVTPDTVPRVPQAERHQLAEHLLALVASRTAELEAVNAKLAQSNKELEAFSYSVSHDLRAPLRAIDGYSRILLEDYGDGLDAEGKRLLHVVRDNATTMSRLIDDMLAFARIGHVELGAVAVDMNELVEQCLSGELASATAGRNLTITVAELPRAYGSAAMLRRVWLNLLDNAIKFTAPKAEARIDVGATSGDGETVYFVRDTGIGFDPRYLGKLFGMFQRLHGTEFPGTGIGLAIIKRIVTRHGGRVWAEGKPGEGSTFFFALPRASDDDAAR